MTTDPTAELRAEVDRLVAAAREGDRAAFDELVRRTYVDTYTLAMRLTANEEDARSSGPRKGVSRVRLCDRGAAAGAGEDQCGGRARGGERGAADGTGVRETAARQQRPDGVALTGLFERGKGLGEQAGRRLEDLARAVATLPPKLRSTVVLKDVYGLSHEAIAEDLGISVAAAKVRLHRGRKRLRDVLFEEGGRSAHAV